MSDQTYETESMDLASYLMACDLDFVEAKEIRHKRHLWVLNDPEGRGGELAKEFANSITADTLDNRKRLVTIVRSGPPRPSDRKG